MIELKERAQAAEEALETVNAEAAENEGANGAPVDVVHMSQQLQSMQAELQALRSFRRSSIRLGNEVSAIHR